MRRLRSESVILIFGMLLAVTCAWGQIPAGSTSPANTGPNSQSGSSSGNGSGGSGDAVRWIWHGFCNYTGW